MNMIKNVALMAMGGAVTLAYQKYNKPVMKAMKKAFGNAAHQAEELTDQLDNMMEKIAPFYRGYFIFF